MSRPLGLLARATLLVLRERLEKAALLQWANNAPGRAGQLERCAMAITEALEGTPTYPASQAGVRETGVSTIGHQAILPKGEPVKQHIKPRERLLPRRKKKADAKG